MNARLKLNNEENPHCSATSETRAGLMRNNPRARSSRRSRMCRPRLTPADARKRARRWLSLMPSSSASSRIVGTTGRLRCNARFTLGFNVPDAPSAVGPGGGVNSAKNNASLNSGNPDSGRDRQSFTRSASCPARPGVMRNTRLRNGSNATPCAYSKVTNSQCSRPEKFA